VTDQLQYQRPSEYEARDWAFRQLSRYTYKPRWTLELVDDQNFMGWNGRLKITYVTPDARSPMGRPIEIRAEFPLPDGVADTGDEVWFAMWLQGCLRQVEDHESREWLRRDGQIYDDPHAKARS
jgi:hypothetical protein